MSNIMKVKLEVEFDGGVYSEEYKYDENEIDDRAALPYHIYKMPHMLGLISSRLSQELISRMVDTRDIETIHENRETV